ncbi:Fe(II)/2-oxoglutarate-dependent dioxygenase nvfI-like protein [Cladobotryum mycophilum]|uniref:Fe(II)/2-oxoglutarate-dependent dioxygenase nvfI-like protein n=1 Tax=Cladobotryum mycophilum TaxID=491253 RepID=A0ABR0SH58_9HYPO
MAEDVTARFSYFQWQEKFDQEKPYYLYLDLPEGVPLYNFSTAPGPTESVFDLRHNANSFNLDDNGFMVMKQDFPLENIDQEAVENVYLPSLEILIRDAVGQDAEIVWFDWRTRSSDPTRTTFPTGTKIQLDDRSISLQPVKAVHVDQSASSAVNRVHRHSGDKADDILKGRVRIINLWRPYGIPVESHPIALLDGSTVPRDKLVEVDVVRQSYIGESYYLLPHDGYRWYFINNQKCDEVLLFKMYDSDDNVGAKCCPHASFDQQVGVGAKPRESIEARALVYTPA